MKRVIAGILILVFVFSFSACGEKEKAKKLPKGATEDQANYPKRDKNKFIENDNETGMIYNFTLDKYTTEFNTMYEKIGGNYKDFPYKMWKKQSSERQSNGKLYNFYYLKNKYVTLTATEEDESRHIVNVGCGITVKKFNSDENKKSKVMTICGIMAAVAGGYTSDDVNFFGNLFADTISAKDNSFWYENCIYIFEKQEASNGENTILFRTMPAEKNIQSEWNLIDYKEYWFEKK